MGAPLPSAGRLWRERVAAAPDAPFLCFGDREWTNAEFSAWVDQLAAGLRAAGVGPGTRIAVLLPNSAELVRIHLAGMLLGATLVPMQTKATAVESAYVLDHARPQWIFTDAAGWAAAELAGRVDRHTIVVLDGHPPAGARASATLPLSSHAPVEPAERADTDPLAIMYTSGSTARPKGVLLPEAGLALTGRAVAARLGLTAADTMLIVLPLFHAGGTHIAFGSALAAGARIVLAPRFSAREFWPLARRSGAAFVNLVPGMLAILRQAPPSPADRDHPLRVVIGAAWDAEFAQRFGVDMVATWSMTETSALGTMTAPGTTHRPGLVGHPTSPEVHIRVIDEAGRPVPPGTRGEILCRHPYVFTGYLDDPESTRRTLVDGWVHTGDIGSLDESGQLYYHGRRKNVIKRHGENISGEELEAVLGRHPAVTECLVLGVPDPIATEEACAVLVVAGRPEQFAAPEQFVDWCRRQGLADWKIPRYLVIRADLLPRLAGGKIDRRAVRRALDGASAYDRTTGGVVPLPAPAE